MNTTLRIPAEVYKDLIDHLVPLMQCEEEAAFMFVQVNQDDEGIELIYQDWYALQPKDFVIKSANHIELKEEIFAQMIMQAHEMKAALVEFHSHLHQEFLRFSPTDWHGLDHVVPNVLWRLKGRPYAAVVVGGNEFDALIWREKDKPLLLDVILVDGSEKLPTANSINQYNEE